MHAGICLEVGSGGDLPGSKEQERQTWLWEAKGTRGIVVLTCALGGWVDGGPLRRLSLVLQPTASTAHLLPFTSRAFTCLHNSTNCQVFRKWFINRYMMRRGGRMPYLWQDLVSARTWDVTRHTLTDTTHKGCRKSSKVAFTCTRHAQVSPCT